MPTPSIPAFRRTILAWYANHARDLPWKRTRDPYKILVSEIMLQQTQVARVLPKYQAFLKRFPTVQALAAAPQRDVLKVWEGLGYWRRAKYLHACAQAVIRDHKGEFPQDIPSLQRLPGIGPYTAGAVACFAFASHQPFIDTNIRRVYLHFFFPERSQVPDAEILEVARRAVWKKDPRTWHYALFDYGATVLRDKRINTRSKHYAKQSTFTGSFRSFRASVLRYALASPKKSLSRRELAAYLDEVLRAAKAPYTPTEILDALVKDELLAKTGSSYTLP